MPIVAHEGADLPNDTMQIHREIIAYCITVSTLKRHSKP